MGRGGSAGTALILVLTVLWVPVLAYRPPLRMSFPVETPRKRVDCEVLVVGGGPGGLACALSLAKRGVTGIHVLDQTPGPSYFEVDKAYLYRIDGRGQRLTDLLGITPRLVDVGVTTSEFLNITIVDPTGNVRTVPAPADPNQQQAYWLPRRALIQFLVDRIQESHADQVTFHYSCHSEQLVMPESLDDPNQSATVVVRVGDGSVMEFCSLRVVGADGMKSRVRKSLEECWSRTNGSKKKKFGVRMVNSLSAGLRYKILQLTHGFPLVKGSDTRTDRMVCYSYVGKPQGRGLAPLRLGCLPFKMEGIPRTANIIASPKSTIFGIKTADGVLKYLREQFPQCDIDSMVTREEAERFAASEGGTFPKPQYCVDVQQRIGGSENGGIVLLGDAIHAFPPDLGAGVNSAFLDVLDLCFALDRCGGVKGWGQAIQLYERMRAPQSRALAKLIPIGFPQQYNHAPVSKTLKMAGVGARVFLSKLFPRLISPPVFFMVQDTRYDYAEVYRRATRTTRIITTGLAALAYAIVAKTRLGPLVMKTVVKWLKRRGLLKSA